MQGCRVSRPGSGVSAGVAGLMLSVGLLAHAMQGQAPSPDRRTDAEAPQAMDEAWRTASAKYDAKRSAILAEVRKVSEAGPFRADWDSLAT